ncbi:PIN domain-containing protein [Microbacterium protaetiae]|uniref:PIN domain-containing protein n=1 Tax=Microbacterium protaetiae TaxID=2509458 RepID=A0A4P6EBS1_9MICO|nr:PIN domain-containing protein [Microbacterium protaetiae]QAY59635.1 PIN domain-containing protein [Microbacterium protaetiae]
MIDPTTVVVFDVNVYLDDILGADGSWPLLPDVPPTTDNPAADAISLAFGGRFRLFASAHILRNVARVMRMAGQSEPIVEQFVSAIVEMCEFSGGGVIEPAERDHGVADYEDNAIVALAKDPSVDALIIVTSDHDLLDLGPARNGRLILRPHEFVFRVLTP